MDFNALKVFVYNKSVDFRKSIAGLKAIVANEMGENPQSGTLYVFVHQDLTKVKILYYSERGFCLWYKKLDSGKFCFSSQDFTIDRLDPTTLAFVLRGFHRHWSATENKSMVAY